MCECGNGCDKYAELENEFASYFVPVMSKWADIHGLDLIGVFNGLSKMSVSLEQVIAMGVLTARLGSTGSESESANMDSEFSEMFKPISSKEKMN